MAWKWVNEKYVQVDEPVDSSCSTSTQGPTLCYECEDSYTGECVPPSESGYLIHSDSYYRRQIDDSPSCSCGECEQVGQPGDALAPITPGVLPSDHSVSNSIFAESPFSVHTENAEPGCDPAACMPGVATPDQCPECRAAPGMPHNAECPCIGDVVDPRLTEEMERDAADWEYVPIRSESKKCDVPFPTQEWFMDEYFGAAFITIDELIDQHYDRLHAMCHRRLREGYVGYGSQMYGWDAKTRLRNILEELADAVIYISSGPVR